MSTENVTENTTDISIDLADSLTPIESAVVDIAEINVTDEQLVNAETVMEEQAVQAEESAPAVSDAVELTAQQAQAEAMKKLAYDVVNIILHTTDFTRVVAKQVTSSIILASAEMRKHGGARPMYSVTRENHDTHTFIVDVIKLDEDFMKNQISITMLNEGFDRTDAEGWQPAKELAADAFALIMVQLQAQKAKQGDRFFGHIFIPAQQPEAPSVLEEITGAAELPAHTH